MYISHVSTHVYPQKVGNAIIRAQLDIRWPMFRATPSLSGARTICRGTPPTAVAMTNDTRSHRARTAALSVVPISFSLLETLPSLLAIPDVLTAAKVTSAQRMLQEAEWVAGRVTPGHPLREGAGAMIVQTGRPPCFSRSPMNTTAASWW